MCVYMYVLTSWRWLLIKCNGEVWNSERIRVWEFWCCKACKREMVWRTLCYQVYWKRPKGIFTCLLFLIIYWIQVGWFILIDLLDVLWMKVTSAYMVPSFVVRAGYVEYVLVSWFHLYLLWDCFGLLQIDEHVQREIMNHRSLKHPNIIRFKEVCYCFIEFQTLHLHGLVVVLVLLLDFQNNLFLL